MSIKKFEVRKAQIYQSVPFWLGVLVRRLLFLVSDIGGVEGWRSLQKSVRPSNQDASLRKDLMVFGCQNPGQLLAEQYLSGDQCRDIPFLYHFVEHNSMGRSNFSKSRKIWVLSLPFGLRL